MIDMHQPFLKHQSILLIAALLTISLAPVITTDSAVGAERDPMWKYPPDLPGARVEVYKTVGNVALRTWIFRPSSASSDTSQRPAIVFFFGGGWRSGTPGQFYHQCQYLASRGMVAMTVDYRVQSRHGVHAGQCLADAKSAIRWIRRNSDRLGVDPEKIVASGGSAGGHLAAATAIVPGFDEAGEDTSVSAVPNALALFNPAVLLDRIDGDLNLSDEQIRSIGERTGGHSRELSPLLHVRRNLPPAIIFHGTADAAVPFWTVKRFTQDMQNAGNRCELKTYPGAPHGFFNTGRGGDAERIDNEARCFGMTTRQLDEFLQSLGYLKGPATILGSPGRNLLLRSAMPNTYDRFQNETSARVAFLGGSITEMNGYRPLMEQWFSQRFPDMEFDFINAGIASTCSLTGASRLEADVLSHGQIDLLLVEFAVNDDQDAEHPVSKSIRGMEGIVRHLRTSCPRAEIVMIHFVNPRMLASIRKGQTPDSIQAHEAVARHYGINSVHVARELADRVDASKMSWEDYGGTHPGPAGNALCARLVQTLLTECWDAAERETSRTKPEPRPLPAPLDSLNYGTARFLAEDEFDVPDGSGWTRMEPDWKKIPGQFRSRFGGRGLLVSDQPGRTLHVAFEGSMLAAYLLAGPDAGQLEVSIDGQAQQKVELFHRFSRGLHYPRTVLLADDLESGRHTAKIRLLPTHHADSRGTVVRILELVEN